MSQAGASPLRIFIIRHGETAWSISGQHTGRTDLPLTAHGEAQARDLAPWLGPIPFAHVFTSPRQRAQRTCALAGFAAAAAIEPDLVEWDYGEFEGRTSADIRQSRPGWNIFRDGCPGGEAPAQIADRADRLLARLAILSGDVALFSHGEFGRALGVRRIGLPVIAGQHFALATASVSILGYDPVHSPARIIAGWNASRGVVG